MDTGWKVTVGGIQSRDLFYTRPFSPYSAVDKATERFYQFLSAGIAVGVIGLIGWQAGLGTALVAGGIGFMRMRARYKHDQETNKSYGKDVSTIEPLRVPKVTQLANRMQGYLHRMGIKRDLRLVDIGAMYKMAGSEFAAAMPNAVSFSIPRSKHAYLGTNRAMAELLSVNEIDTVMAHESGHQGREMTLWNDHFKRLKLFTNTAIVIGAVFASPWLLALLPAQSLLMKSFGRHEEFRADRASAYLTKQPMVLVSALRKMQWHINGGRRGGNSLMMDSAEWALHSMFRGAKELLCDHPSVERRERRLEAMQRQINASTPRRRSGSGAPYMPVGQYAI
jgi:Zn-dependent protease with chaperone function